MMKQRIHYHWLVLFFCDFAAISAAYYTTYFFRFYSSFGTFCYTKLNLVLGVRETGLLPELHRQFYAGSAFRIILILTLAICTLYALFNLYGGRRFIFRRPTTWFVLLSNVTALALFYIYFYLRRNDYHPRSMFATMMALNIGYTIGFRALMELLLSGLRRRFDFDRCPVVMLGSDAKTQHLADYIEAVAPHGLHVVETVPMEGEGDGDNGAFAETLQRLESVITRTRAAMVVTHAPALTVPQVMLLLELCDRLGLPIKIASQELAVVVTRARIASDLVQGIPLVNFEAPSEGGRLLGPRQQLSRVVAVLAVVVLAPLFGLIALAIWLSSPGPILFVQDRIGINREPFRMFKFRTMRHRADEMQAQLEEFNDSDETLFKLRHDPRVTPVGGFLRRFSLDELPQLINVIRGEMTIVGPRPLPRRDFENYFEEWHYTRHAGLPGLTCLWQVSGRSDLDFHHMCLLDVYYLRNHSWVLDVRIVIKTVWTILFGDGAY